VCQFKEKQVKKGKLKELKGKITVTGSIKLPAAG